MTAKLILTGNFVIDKEQVFGMGIRFIAISPEDQQHTAFLVGAELFAGK